MAKLKPAEDFHAIDRLLLNAFEDLANAVREIRTAMFVHQSIDDRRASLRDAKTYVSCVSDRIEAAKELIPLALSDSDD